MITLACNTRRHQLPDDHHLKLAEVGEPRIVCMCTQRLNHRTSWNMFVSMHYIRCLHAWRVCTFSEYKYSVGIFEETMTPRQSFFTTCLPGMTHDWFYTWQDRDRFVVHMQRVHVSCQITIPTLLQQVDWRWDYVWPLDSPWLILSDRLFLAEASVIIQIETNWVLLVHLLETYVRDRLRHLCNRCVITGVVAD